MKKSFFILLVNLLLLTACGKDRSGEYYALTQDAHWIEETMMRHYLWNDEMGEVNKKDFFAKPEDFLQKRVNKRCLEGKGDRFSRIEYKDEATARATNSVISYGFDFELITDPLKTTQHNFARVLQVYPNSPAAESGLNRGDWIAEINGEKLTIKNAQLLNRGGEIVLTRQTITHSGDSLSWAAKDHLKLPAARFVEKNPFQKTELLQIEGKKIAYLLYNQFSTGPNNLPEETEYVKQMVEIFSQFKAQQPDNFILDLRFNPGGYLSCAVQLASLLAPTSALGKECFELKYNESANPQIESIAFDTAMGKHNLGLKKLYILTSSNTASASEALINGLSPYMGKENIILVGEQTYGKPVATNLFSSEELNFNLHLVMAFVLNSKGEANYNNGFSPTFPVQETDITKPLLPLGNPDEYLLNYTLQLITKGIAPQPMEQKVKYQTLYRSCEKDQNTQGLKLNVRTCTQH